MKIQTAHFDPATGEVRQLGIGEAFEIAGLQCCEFRNVSYYDVQFISGLRVNTANLIEQHDGVLLGEIIVPTLQ